MPSKTAGRPSSREPRACSVNDVLHDLPLFLHNPAAIDALAIYPHGKAIVSAEGSGKRRIIASRAWRWLSRQMPTATENRPDVFNVDGVHLNAIGYRLLAETLHPPIVALGSC